MSEGRLDGLLIDRARERDADAFAALVRPRLAGMLRTATAILGHEGDASDALQDALVRAWHGLPRLREPERFEAWLTRILVNECRTAIKQRSRTRVREVQLDPNSGAWLGAPSGPHGADAVVARLALEDAFERLRPEDRAILVLHHLEGRSLEEIADLLGIPVGTAKSRLYAARHSLDRFLRR